MATKPKQDYGVVFVNIELKFSPELYFQKSEVIPDEAFLFNWLAQMAPNYWRFGFGYNGQSSSFTASATYRGGLTTDTPPCLTQHGRSPLSALLKLYVVLELCGGAREGFKFASDALAELEGYLEAAVQKLL